MITDIETLRANLARLDRLAHEYGNALVECAQRGDEDRREVMHNLTELHNRLNAAAKAVADTL